MSEKINALVAEISRLRRLNLPFGDLRDKLDEAMAHQDFSKSKDIYRSIGIVSVSIPNLLAEFKKVILSEGYSSKKRSWLIYLSLIISSSEMLGDIHEEHEQMVCYYFDADPEDIIHYVFTDEEIIDNINFYDKLTECSVKGFKAATSAIGEIIYNNNRFIEYLNGETDVNSEQDKFIESLFLFCFDSSEEGRKSILRNISAHEESSLLLTLLTTEVNDTIRSCRDFIFNSLYDDVTNSSSFGASPVENDDQDIRIVNPSNPSLLFENYKMAEGYGGLFFDMGRSLAIASALFILDVDEYDYGLEEHHEEVIKLLSESLKNFENERFVHESYIGTFRYGNIVELMMRAIEEETLGDHLQESLEFCNDHYESIFSDEANRFIEFYRESSEQQRFMASFRLLMIENHNVVSSFVIEHSQPLSRILNVVAELAMNFYDESLSQTIYYFNDLLKRDDDEFQKYLDYGSYHFPNNEDYNDVLRKIEARLRKIRGD